MRLKDVYIYTVRLGQCMQRVPGDSAYRLCTFMHCVWVSACKLYIHSVHTSTYTVPIDQHINITILLYTNSCFLRDKHCISL